MTKRDPDRCPTHPGIFLRDMVLPGIKKPKTQIAKALGMSRQQLYDVLNGKQPVSPKTAVRLEALLGRSARSWLIMQAAHDVWNARQVIDISDIQKFAAAR